MTIREARLIRELKKRCTYRRLAEIFYTKKENGYGNQLYGKDLCLEAFKTLYPKKKHPFTINVVKESNKFKEDNKSYLGDFYWWE